MQITKQKDIEYHRLAAAKYDAGVTRHYRFYHRYSLHPWIRNLTARIPAPDALDIGTGTGVAACDLAQFGCRVQAVDHSPEMLAIAKETAQSMGIGSRITFAVGDGEKLNFPDASFDAVVIQGVLHHLDDRMPILREAVRVLRPGGEIYISEPCIEGTPVSNFINGITSRIRRWLSVLGNAAPPAEHEKPINGPSLVSDLQRMGLTTNTDYLIKLGMLRFVPDPLRIYIVLALSSPTRRKRGDIIFLIGRKQPSV